MSKKDKIRVLVKHGIGWNKTGEIHEVGNYVSFGYSSPCFEKKDGYEGIACDKCIILGDNPSKQIIEWLRDDVFMNIKDMMPDEILEVGYNLVQVGLNIEDIKRAMGAVE